MSQLRPGTITEITAVSNPRVKSVRALSQKKHRDESGTFLAEGMKLVIDAREQGWEIDTLVFCKSAASDQLLDFAARVRTSGTDILEVNEKVLTSITRKDNPQMVLGVMRQRWAELPSNVKDPSSVWIALDRVRDPGNLGTILRTSDAAGVDGVILLGETTDPYSLEAVRASMGSIFNVGIVRADAVSFANFCSKWSGIVVGTHLEGAVDYRTIDYASQPVLLMMGNEQQGLTDELAGLCDQLALIPMQGAADSLNLAIATGVMLFEMKKRMPPVPISEAVK